MNEISNVFAIHVSNCKLDGVYTKNKSEKIDKRGNLENERTPAFPAPKSEATT